MIAKTRISIIWTLSILNLALAVAGRAVLDVSYITTGISLFASLFGVYAISKIQSRAK